MSGQCYTFDRLEDMLEQLSYSKPEEINPLIKAFLATCPGSSVFGLGGHSVVLRLCPDIAVKVSKHADEELLRSEQEVFALLDPFKCANIVQHYLSVPDAIFLEFLPDSPLYVRIACHDKPRPITRWMLQLTGAVACIEALGYAHGDINPKNIIFDEKDDVKLLDFDHTLKAGGRVDVGLEPYVRGGRRQKGDGQYGSAGPVTDQFALGSIFWFMTRGTQVYDDIPGHEQVNLMYDGVMPATDPEEPIDCIIQKCWDGEYETIADLVREIQELPESELEPCSAMAPEPVLGRKVKCERYYAKALAYLKAATTE